MDWSTVPDRGFIATASEAFSPFLARRGIWGFGYYFGPGVQQPSPLLAVSETLVAVDPLSPEPLLLPGTDSPSVLQIGHLKSASPALEPALELIEGARDAIFLPVGTPQPLASTGDPIRCPISLTRGTLGFVAQRVDSSGTVHDGFLSAGHCFPYGAGSTVDLVTAQKPAHKHTQLGTVTVHSDPGVPPPQTSNPGFDVAFVEVTTRSQPAGVSVAASIARLPAVQQTPLPVELVGGVSALVYAGIIGSLQLAGVASRQWRDCWLMVPGVATQGDSGAAVFTTGTGRGAVGTLVGGSRQLGASADAVHYVQDLDSAVQGFLQASGIRV